jgi:hypothetical protein
MFGDPAIQQSTVVVSVNTTASIATLNQPLIGTIANTVSFAYQVSGNNVPSGAYISTVSGSLTGAVGDTITLVYASGQPAPLIASGETTLNVDASLYPNGETLTTIFTTPVACAMPTGMNLYLGYGNLLQTLTTSAPMSKGDTVVQVSPFVPSFTFPSNNVANGVLTNTISGAGLGAIASFGLTSTVSQGQALVLNSGSNAQQITSSATESQSTEFISVLPFTPNYAYDDTASFITSLPLTLSSGVNSEIVYPYTIPVRQSNGTYVLEIASPTVNSYDATATLSLYASPSEPTIGDIRYVPSAGIIEKYDGENWNEAVITDVAITVAIQGSSIPGDKTSLSLLDSQTKNTTAADTYINAQVPPTS